MEADALAVGSRFGFNQGIANRTAEKASLETFWLRDESLEESDNLPDPDILAQEIVRRSRSRCTLRENWVQQTKEVGNMSHATKTEVGSVVSLWQYPVKSMLGEELNATEVTERGLLGDRAYALVDSADGKVATAKNPRKWPALRFSRHLDRAGACGRKSPSGPNCPPRWHHCHQ